MRMYRMMTRYKGGKEEGTNGDPKPLACVHRRTSVVEVKGGPRRGRACSRSHRDVESPAYSPRRKGATLRRVLALVFSRGPDEIENSVRSVNAPIVRRLATPVKQTEKSSRVTAATHTRI